MGSIVDSYLIFTNILSFIIKIMNATCSVCKFVLVKGGKKMLD